MKQWSSFRKTMLCMRLPNRNVDLMWTKQRCKRLPRKKWTDLKQLNSLDLHGITPWRFQDPAALNAAWRCLEKSPCGARRAVFLLGRIQLKRGPCNMWPYDTLQRGSRFNSWSSSEKEWVGKNGISKALPLCGCSSHSINYLALMIACCSGSIRNISVLVLTFVCGA